MKMSYKTIISSICSFALDVILVGAATSATNLQSQGTASGQLERTADRDAIRAHIDKIFKAFVNSDCETIRATHAANWIGFTNNGRSIMKGLDEYMKGSARFCVGEKPTLNPSQLADFKLSEVDYVFYGDVALVPYVAETTYGTTARIPGKVRSLDIYAKVNGAWTQVGSNISMHPDALAAMRSMPGQLTPPDQKALLATRETVWRAFFSNDQSQLEKLIPNEALVVDEVNPGGIGKRADIFEAAKKFAEGGTKLTRLEFPRTEMQVYGDTAILYTTYSFDVEKGDRRITQTGRGTEIFVKRNGSWLNTGWQLDSDK